jgi:hypothetical protein
MLEGSCLCGAVRYEAQVPAGPIVHCHCRTCRKAHGSAFSTVMPIPREAFRWVSGENALKRYESSPGKFRSFCTCCGSQIVAERTNQNVILLRLGCLDTPISDRPLQHIWRSDCASWYDPKDQLPELLEGVARQGP